MKGIIIRTSRIAGKGIFAIRNFKKNEFIFAVEGPTIKYPFAPNWWIGANWLNLGHNIWKIPYRHTTWNFINHSCDPNAGLHGKSNVVAIRPIKPGEEITIDYSTLESHPDWKMSCNCQSKKCRKIIRSIQYLPEALFKKYKNYISKDLQKAYVKQKVYASQKGNGIFAKKGIRKDEVIFEVEGPIIKYDEAPDYKIGFRWLGISKNRWLIPNRNNPWWRMRHSCNPNVGIADKKKVVAMRTIMPDEEIVIDDSIIEADPRWRVRCSCGMRNCRKIIRSVQYLPVALFKKYRNYIPPFFQSAYKSATMSEHA